MGKKREPDDNGTSAPKRLPPSDTSLERRLIIEEYANALRDLLKWLRKRLNGN